MENKTLDLLCSFFLTGVPSSMSGMGPSIAGTHPLSHESSPANTPFSSPPSTPRPSHPFAGLAAGMSQASVGRAFSEAGMANTVSAPHPVATGMRHPSHVQSHPGLATALGHDKNNEDSDKGEDHLEDLLGKWNSASLVIE